MCVPCCGLLLIDATEGRNLYCASSSSVCNVVREAVISTCTSLQISYAQNNFFHHEDEVLVAALLAGDPEPTPLVEPLDACCRFRSTMDHKYLKHRCGNRAFHINQSQKKQDYQSHCRKQ
jgi:hypothetical protein